MFEPMISAFDAVAIMFVELINAIPACGWLLASWLLINFYKDSQLVEIFDLDSPGTSIGLWGAAALNYLTLDLFSFPHELWFGLALVIRLYVDFFVFPRVYTD